MKIEDIRENYNLEIGSLNPGDFFTYKEKYFMMLDLRESDLTDYATTNVNHFPSPNSLNNYLCFDLVKEETVLFGGGVWVTPAEGKIVISN